jgi:hypothetical protein
MTRGRLSNIVELALITLLVVVAHVATSHALRVATATFQGRVTSAGKPVIGASIEVRGLNMNWQGKTNGKGRFSSEELSVDTYTLEASASGYTSVKKSLPLRAPSTVVNFVLESKPVK